MSETSEIINTDQQEVKIKRKVGRPRKNPEKPKRPRGRPITKNGVYNYDRPNEYFAKKQLEYYARKREKEVIEIIEKIKTKNVEELIEIIKKIYNRETKIKDIID
jgi:hypothetical protein